MVVSTRRRILETTGGTGGSPPVRHLAVVVGYDGSEPARHALDLATDLLRDRVGTLEVVYVAHLPAGAALSATGSANSAVTLLLPLCAATPLRAS